MTNTDRKGWSDEDSRRYWLDELVAEGSVQVETATGSEDLPWNIAWGSVETPDKLCSCMQECCDKLVCLPEVCDPATQWKYLDSQTMLTRVSAPCGKTPRNDLWFQNIARKKRCIPAGLCVLFMHYFPLALLPRPKENDGTLLGSTFEQCNAQDQNSMKTAVDPSHVVQLQT